MQTIALLILIDIIALPAYNNNRRQQCLKIVPAPRYAADKWSGSQILPLPGMRLINGWDKNVCRASSKDGALHLWEVFMLDAQLYFLSDQYYIDFPDDKLMQNKDMIDGIRRSRPCFLAFPDSKNPSIYWLVPISSRYEKYQKIAQSKIEKYGRCNTIRFGTVLGRNAAFLIQNMCPVTEFYLTAYIDKNKVPIRLDDRIVEDVTKNAREVLASPGEAQRSSSRMYSNFIRSWKRHYKNKNRGTSVVKRHVPFLFSVFVKAAVPEPPSPRRRERSKPECRALPKEKESMEWRNRNPLQKVPQPRLDLTNLAVTTGYHSLS